MIIENQRCSLCMSKEQSCHFLKRVRSVSGNRRTEMIEEFSGVYEMYGCPNLEEVIDTYGNKDSRSKQGFDEEKPLIHPTERRQKQQMISLDSEYVEAFLSRYTLNEEVRMLIDLIVEVRRGYTSKILTEKERKEFADTIVRMFPGGPDFQIINRMAVRCYVKCVYHWMHGYVERQDLTPDHKQELFTSILGFSTEYDDSWELPGIVRQVL